MIVSGYGVKLIRLKERDIELVRQKRNSDQIRQFMEYREYITPEMQEKWFRKINNIHNNYFVIQNGNKKIGLINGAQINWEKKETGSGGVFIWETEYWDTKVPLASSLLLTDTSVLLGLERTYAKILRDNKKAIAFNKALGYRLIEGEENSYNQRYVLSMKDYVEKRNRLREKLFPEDSYRCIKLEIDKEDANDPVVTFLMKKISSLSGKNRAGFEITIHEGSVQ